MTAVVAADRELSTKRCAIYTRKSTDEGLDSDFSSLDAQRASCSAYIASQRHENWTELPDLYDDGGYSGGSLDRPAFQRLLSAVKEGQVDVIVVYKVDRLTRSLLDFSRIIDTLDASGASFVSITQSFNSTTSMGRLTLNVLLSFAQFEREVASERVRDKIAASKAKGIWMGGTVPLGYDIADRRLIVNASEAATVRQIFDRYLCALSGVELVRELAALGIRSKARDRQGEQKGQRPIGLGALYAILKNPIYAGKIAHRDKLYDGRHNAIIDQATFDSVQQKLARNNVTRRRQADAKEQSPLRGLISDSYNRSMIPSHTQRRGRRYRYYVSQDRVGQVTRPTWRVSANEIERLVVENLIRALELGMDNFITDTIAATDQIIEVQAVTRSTIDTLRQWPSNESAAVMREAISNIFIGEDQITICGSFGFLKEVLRDLADFRLHASSRAVRRGKSINLIMPPATSDAAASEPLLRLVTQAFSVKRRLEASNSILDVASSLRIHPDYVVDLARIAFLSPSLLTALVEGTQPDGLTRKSLMEASNLPLQWDRQRQFFQL